MTVLDGLEGRDDLIAEFEEKIFVIEVKGKTKSAAEGDAAQLEKWVSTHMAEKSKLPKGLLVVNAYREIPLEERTEDVFPNQMLKFSKQREHCLMSGLQLLCLYLSCNDDALKKRAAIDSIFNCTDVYPDFRGNSWQSVIQFLDSEIAPEIPATSKESSG
jgi:hypothetical protein